MTIGSGASSQTFTYDQENRLVRTGPCQGDANDDGSVTSADLGIVAAHFGAEGTAAYDLSVDVLSGDGVIGSNDLGVVAAQFARQCRNTGPNTGNARNFYNGDGLRVRQRTFVNGQGTAIDDDYAWDTGASLPVVLQDTRTQGTSATTTYLYGLGLISTTDGAGVTSYYLADGLGSTAQLTDSAGTVTDSYTYDVFGAPRLPLPSTANPFRFTGQQDDAGANRGLYYLRARAYDPALGRFLQQDSIPSSNRYAYALNNPAILVDPSGLLPCVRCFVACGLDPHACAVELFTGSWFDKKLVHLAGLAVAALADSEGRDKEGGIHLIENCSSAFCNALFASTGLGVDTLHAITIGDTILAPGGCDIGCIAHETVHVNQYRDLGFIGFYEEYYGVQSAENAFGCVSSGVGFFKCLYDNNALEIPAYKAGEDAQ